jgi:hypothetical protein
VISWIALPDQAISQKQVSSYDLQFGDIPVYDEPRDQVFDFFAASMFRKAQRTHKEQT